MISNYDKQVDIGRKYFLQYDSGKIAKKYSLKSDEEFLYLSYLGDSYRINRKNAVVEQKEQVEAEEWKDKAERTGKEEKAEGGWKECRNFNAVMTIYDILCHGKDKPLTPLSGEWMPIGRFVISGANPDADTFSRKYALSFSEKIDALKNACISIGGEILPRLAGADITVKIPAFSFFPLIFQFWDGDDEFEPQIKILWDKNTLDYLNFETTYYLQGDLLDKLMGAMTKE